MFNYGYPYQQYQQYMPKLGLQQQTELIRVTGIEGAKAYQMQPNSVVPLFDGGDDIMYIKSTDGANFPTIKTFKFMAIDVPEKGSIEYVSKAEFEKFKSEVLNYGKQFVQQYGYQPSNNQSSKTDNERCEIAANANTNVNA